METTIMGHIRVISLVLLHGNLLNHHARGSQSHDITAVFVGYRVGYLHSGARIVHIAAMQLG